MVAYQKLFNTPLARYRLGVALIWLGVLIWAPYIVLRFTGQAPSPLWFLPFHLVGVIGGSRLRSHARKELGLPAQKRNLWRVFGHVLIWAGVAVWAPYFYFKMIVGVPVDVMNYLPYHLIGVLGGVLLLVIAAWTSKSDNGILES